MLMNTDRARRLMEADGIDGVISATLESNFYLSGIWQHGQEVFPRDGEAYTVAAADNPAGGAVVCSIGAADLALCGYDSLSGVYTFGTFFRDYIAGTSLTPGEQRVLDITSKHSTDSGVLDALAAALHALGLASARVAVEETGPNRQLIAQLSERLPQATFVPGRTLLRRIRMVKTEGERELMLGALRATEAAMRAAIGAAREGVTERELRADLRAHHPRPGRPPELHPAALRPWPGARADPGRGGAAAPRRHDLLRRGLQLRRLQVRHRPAGVVRRADARSSGCSTTRPGPASRPRST